MFGNLVYEKRKDAERIKLCDSEILRLVKLVSLTTDTYSGRTG